MIGRIFSTCIYETAGPMDIPRAINTPRGTHNQSHILYRFLTVNIPIKRLANKNKKTPEKGQSSRSQASNPNLGLGQPNNPQRILSSGERWTLLQTMSQSDLDWMLKNESLQVRDFIDAKLASGPSITSDTEVDISPFIQDSDSDTPDQDPNTLKQDYRRCRDCSEHGLRDEMVKCRECSYWFHTDHFRQGGVTRVGRVDPRFRFWKCSDYKTAFPRGPTVETATPAELEADDNYEDSANED